VARSAEVRVCALLKDEVRIPDASPLQEFCASVEPFRVPASRGWARHLRDGGRHAIAGRPLATYPFYFDEFAAMIRATAARSRADLIQIEHSFLAPYLAAAPPACRTVLSFHNIGQLQYDRIAALHAGDPVWRLKALAMRGWEASWAAKFDHSIAVSETDAQFLGPETTVIENGVDCGVLRVLEPPGAGKDLLFVGAFGYPPNADAVRFFTTEVLPLIQAREPSARLVVVGKQAGPDIKALAADGRIELHENVPDVVPYYRRAALALAPLRAGGGTRLKILEAMALGRAVVSTPVGCEGLAVEHGRELLIAEGATEFAEAVLRLLAAPALGCELATRARAVVEQTHDWRILGARLVALYRSILS
jgi:glycosyltransferase involved in cell wall biosynthesis